MKERIETLTRTIREADRLYYEEDAPKMADELYDELFNELKELEEKYPEYKAADSPTDKVGGQTKDTLAKIKHKSPMYSLSNVFNEEELKEFLKKEDTTYVVEPKIDGLALNLEYEEGVLKRAATRGDGVIGENVLNIVEEIADIPKTINDDSELLSIRGEVYLSDEDFDEINKERAAAGLNLYINSRNAAAGLLRRLEADSHSRRLKFFAHGIDAREGSKEAYSSYLEGIFQEDFNHHKFYLISKDEDEIIDFVKEIEAKREDFGFRIDGAVIKIDEIKKQEEIGFTSSTPKWATAYKFAAEQKETIVEDIFITVGRTGRATPNAKLKPVTLADTKVSYATLHNADMIALKDIRVGDKVIVHKSGDIIPEVVRVVDLAAAGRNEPYVFDTHCPACNGPLVKEEGAVNHYCTNPKCSSRLKGSFELFASQQALDIQGLGEKLIENLINEGLIERVSDLAKLKDKKEDLLKLPRMGEKTMENLLANIEKAKEMPLDRLICGLGIPLIGSSASKEVAAGFESLDEFRKADANAIEAINLGGSVAKDNILDYLNDSKNQEILKELVEQGFGQKGLKEEKTSNDLEGLTIVITGSFEGYSRKDIKAELEAAGAKVTSSVSGNTDVLIAGERAGSKKEQAEKLGTLIIEGYHQESIQEIKKAI